MLGRRLRSFIKRNPTTSQTSKVVDVGEGSGGKSWGRRAVSGALICLTGGVALSALNDLAIYHGCSSKAMEKASKNEAIVNAIGEPIERGPWYNASLAVAHKRSSVSCTFPVSGPQGTGIFQLKAVRNADSTWFSLLRPQDWDILIMEALVHVPSNDEKPQTLRINLSSNTLPASTTPPPAARMVCPVPTTMPQPPPDIQQKEEEQQYVPVWIQLHNLPLEFWKPRLLSKLCTFIGQPLHTDQLTNTRERISFARCLVQVAVNLDLPTILTLHLPGGKVIEQPVLYENRPLCCTKCKRIGHEASACRDTGTPKLYVMKKPKNKVDKGKKVNPVSAPVDTWVQVGKTTDEIVDEEEPEIIHRDTQEKTDSEVYTDEDGSTDDEDGNDSDNENEEEESEEEEPEEEAEDRDPPVVKALQASAPAPTPTPPPSASTQTTLILKGDRSPPRVPPPGYDIHVDENGGWELFPIWPTVQDAASLPRVTRSKKKK